MNNSKMWNKVLCILIFVTMIFSVVACSSPEEEMDGKDTQTEALVTGGGDQQEKTSTEDVPVIEYFLPWDAGKPISDDLPFIKEWGKAVGVSFKIINPPLDTFKEQFTALVASKNLPDMINFFRDTNGDSTREYGDELFVSITDALENGKLNNYKKYYEKFKREFDSKVASTDGNMYGFVMINNIDVWSSPGWYVRNDILKTKGMDAGDIRTLDELKKALLLLKDANNGDPITGSRLGYSYTAGRFMHYLGANHGMHTDTRTGGSGKWVWGPAQPAFKTGVEFSRWAYENEVFHQNIFTMDKKEFFAKLADGTFALHMGGGFENMYNNMPERDVQILLPPEIDGNKISFPLSSHLSFGYRWPVVINKDSKVIDDCLRAMDYVYSDEGVKLTSYGVEGVNYVINKQYPIGMDFTLTIERTEKPDAFQALQHEGYAQWWTMGVLGSDMWAKRMLYKPGEEELSVKSINDMNKLLNNGNLHEPDITFLLNEEEEELKAEILLPLETYCEENGVNFMTGYKPMSEWDSFLEGMEKLRYKELEQLYNKAAARNK